MMNIKYETKRGTRFDCDGVNCAYNVSTFTNERDFNKGLEWYENHIDNYKDIRVRICSVDYAGTMGIQILSLEKELFEYYEQKKNKEVLRATGA